MLMIVLARAGPGLAHGVAVIVDFQFRVHQKAGAHEIGSVEHQAG